jgi:serpin B
LINDPLHQQKSGNAPALRIAMQNHGPNDSEHIPTPKRTQSGQPLSLLVLVVVIFVCVALFRGGNRLGDTANTPVSAARGSGGSLDETSRAKEIRSALDRRIDVNYLDRDLEDCIHDVARQLAIQVYVDHRELKQMGVALDQPITIDLRDISARSVFKFLLEPVMLTYDIRDDVLFITTVENVKEKLETRAYDVTDLVVVSGGNGAAEADFAPLMELIRSAFRGEFRDDAVPPRSIEAFSGNGVNSLVIRQDQVTLRVIAALLAELKTERHAELAAVKARPSPTKTQSSQAHSKTQTAAGSTARFDAVVRGNNEFALALYSRLARERKGNIFFSPFSISSGMAIVYAGARGETAREIQETMHYLPWHERVPTVFSGLTLAVTQPFQTAGKAPAASLGVTVANRVWFQDGIEIDLKYRHSLAKHFAAEPAMVDFTERERVALEINRRVEQDTLGLVKGLVGPEQFGVATRFVLTNAVGFAGTWTRPFREALTAPSLFRTPNGFTDVPLMSLLDHCGYVEIKDENHESLQLQVLDKPYGNGELSMVILLPGSSWKLSDVELQLTERQLAEWLAPVEQRQIEVRLPRFRVESGLDLVDDLRNLGLQHAFASPWADFSGISAKEPLALAAVVHKAVVEVNEHGTRAVAVSELSGFLGGRDPVFMADSPFIFLIRDNRTGCILFLGRLVDPNSK